MPTVEANGLSFHVVDEGDGPAVLLLHGFPDSSQLWRHQVPALAEAGYRVIAAAFMPEQVERLCAISVGHPNAFAGADLAQWEKSWYMLWFQFPGVADAALPRNDWQLLREWTRGAGDTDRYVKDLARPGALTAALNWYRANISPDMVGADDALPLPPARCPTLGIWSTGDVFLVEEQMTGSEKYVEGPWRYERIEGASHWVPLEEPDRLNQLLLDFMRS